MNPEKTRYRYFTQNGRILLRLVFDGEQEETTEMDAVCVTLVIRDHQQSVADVTAIIEAANTASPLKQWFDNK